MRWFHLMLVTQALQQGESWRCPNTRLSVNVVLLRPLLPPCGQEREGSGQVGMNEVDVATGRDDGGRTAPPAGPVHPSPWLRLYLWVTWLLRRPGNVCSVSELSEPPGGEKDSEAEAPPSLGLNHYFFK